jgi:hypothetical protein
MYRKSPAHKKRRPAETGRQANHYRTNSTSASWVTCTVPADTSNSTISRSPGSGSCASHFSQGTGWTVAHYALEQLPDGKGDYPSELEALGRMWWLRFESGFETDQAHGERKAYTVPELLGNALFWLTLSTACWSYPV